MKFDIKLYRNGCSVMVTKEAPSNWQAWQLALNDEEIKSFIESSDECYDRSIISQEAKDNILRANLPAEGEIKWHLK